MCSKHLVESNGQARIPGESSVDGEAASALADPSPASDSKQREYFGFDVETQVKRFQFADFVKFWAATRLRAAPSDYGLAVDCEMLIATQHSPDDSAMGRLARCFSRIERPGHVLYWSKGAASRTYGDTVAVTHIELPRLELTFDVQPSTITSL